MKLFDINQPASPLSSGAPALFGNALRNGTVNGTVPVEECPGHIAHVGNFPPQKCGIATFTADTVTACRDAFPAMANDLYILSDANDDAPEITANGRTSLVERRDRSAYRRAALQINASGAEAAWVQHEFGIFGGEEGDYLLDFIDALRVPLAVTLHTILTDPTPRQFGIMQAILHNASRVIVMAQKGREILLDRYGADPAIIEVIPHGIPDEPYVEPARVKPAIGVANDPVILTFGLMSRSKGIADMIDAMPAIVERVPNARYIVLGATHPGVIAHEGESYRDSLKEKVARYGLEDNIIWVDRYVELDELTRYLQAADVYVTPYHNPEQITSGTLSYAVGLGKPVVSTGYVHASELLDGGIGELVPFHDPAALARKVGDLLTDDVRRERIAQYAYAIGRTMTWERYAEAAARTLARAAGDRAMAWDRVGS